MNVFAKMKVFVLISCLVLGVHCSHRVKRIVGGEKAAIPKPLEIAPGAKTEQTAATGSTRAGVGVAASTTKYEIIKENIVEIFEEDRTSIIEGVKEKNGYISFKGIRYAKPPTEKNRFQRPIFAPLKGEVKANNYGSPCIQPSSDNSGVVGKEDCLFLNVFTPSIYVKNATGYPVFFWIHGGGFMSGSGNQYGVSDLVAKNIVVVTINYRLGTLGFFGARDQQMSGNAGLFDVRAAFEWTRRYITYFGGNPRRIFTAGQGSGASLATLLAQSDFTSGYIKGVFAMSGTGISSNAVDYSPTNTSTFIANSSNCVESDPLKLVRCLQKSSINSIFNGEKALQDNRIGEGGFVNAISKLLTAGPLVEGKNDGRFLPYFLHDNPLDALKQKKVSKVPLLTGTVKSETGKAITGKFREDVLSKLQIPDFLNKVLPKSLVDNNIGRWAPRNHKTNQSGIFVGEAASKLINLLFANDLYLKLFSIVSHAANDIEKVVESTTDALFNLPAVTTSQLWSTAGAESYVYRFEHESTKPVKGHFLSGLSVFSSGSSASQEESVTASHGDDLLYLFELQTLEGQRVPDAVLQDAKDLKVKNLFVNVVAEFLHSGKPKIPDLKENWPPFSKDNSYAVISETPRYEKKFRFCQVALWGGLVDALKDPFCNLPGINDVLKLVPEDLLKGGGILNPGDISKKLDKVIPSKFLPKFPMLPGGSKDDTKNTPLSGLGGLSLLGKNGNQKNDGKNDLTGGLFGLTNTNTETKQTTKIPVAHIGLKLPLG